MSQIPESGEGTSSIAVAHGIFGRGRNWRTFSRKLVADRPPWRALLLDLRAHGASAASIEARGPHTLAAAAADVCQTVSSDAPAALLGHSFGGKVMLAARATLPSATACWLIDSSPSAQLSAMDAPAEHTPVAVAALRHLESLPERIESREAFVAALGARGVERGVGQFLAMNLERDGDQFRLAIDLTAIRDLLASYFATDLWSEVEREDRGSLHIAIAGRDSALSADDQERLEALAAARDHVHIHRFPSAGHWIHAEEPAALLELLRRHTVL